jgi:glutaredoxin
VSGRRGLAVSRSSIVARCTLVALLVSASASAVGAGCGRRRETPVKTADAPPLVVRDDSAGLLLTWIDEKGDFHVEQKVSDVPLVGRDAVRAVDPTREEGTHSDQVFVADLRVARPDGTYAVRSMTRAEFDALAVARREKATPPVEPGAATGTEGRTEGQGASDPSPSDGTKPASGRPAVIIYGASWCGACHDAAAYLRRKGIAFIEKDIEKDPAAAREMQGKLTRAGLRAGSIPVLDVRGHVMVGFNPSAVDGALGQAL